ncbi:MAG: outer membrane lipoprotein LolB [Methylotenera sp.]|nr:outer membrane lipoprotein LolB [Methylotenera sp.]
MKRYFVIILITLLQACATTPMNPANTTPTQPSQAQHLQQIATIQQFSLKGRMGVQTDAKGFSGRLDWQHQLSYDNIALYSPLGNQVASIQKTASLVTLQDASGNSVSAADAESLTEMTLGWKLPLTGLADWSLGRPTASPIQASTSDNLGRLTTLKQDGWDIEYSDYVDVEGKQLPNKIYMRSPKVNIKLIIEDRSH